jgi:hypothetical protein
MAQFEALFTTAFGDSDRERVVIYAVEFQQLICDFEWNNKTFINRFLYGLKDDVKDLLITMPKIETLQDFITQAITCDNRLFERHQEKRFGWRNANHTMITSTSLALEKKYIEPEIHAD